MQLTEHEKQDSSFHFQHFILSSVFFLGQFFLKVPYVQVLPEELKCKTAISIYGEPKQNAERFAIDICRGDDIAFHFNPRFNEDGKQVIMRSSRIRGVWGPEERELRFFPFRPGKPFVIKIFFTFSGFRVEVDSHHVPNYAHRIKELDQITHIQIHQDIDLNRVHIGDIFLRDPYVQILPEGVIDQMLITVHGAPKKGVERFDINICKGFDMAFHFNPRFNENGRQVVVRTSRIDGFWGSEERHLPFFPFRHEQPFEIKILCTASGYRVETDTNLMLHYAHRIWQLKEMTHILIVGVDLKYVHVENAVLKTTHPGIVGNPAQEGCFLRVPYIQGLLEGLKDQSLITIYGAPKDNADRFSFNICKGKDVAFHFSPRFNEHGRQLIVMASLIQNRWCPRVEEYSLFPFRRGRHFEIKIFCTSSGYRVEVDKVHVLHYIHSFWEMDQITHFHIHRDVVLKDVHIDM
ncbi:galectin-4-like [Colossoma macropomum]|uniref:galectin-4-like n=1 Tax=Colossoma macropomum TaxID=42526 RepID=UPI001864590B|nr:galectin-4-like [Colossoma macropomum]